MNDVSTARCLAVWFVATAASGALAGFLLPDLVAAHRALTTGGVADQPFDALLEWLCATAALLATAWLWMVTTVVTARAGTGGSARPVAGVPAPLRRLLLVACGVALTGGMAAPAGATPGNPHRDDRGTVTAALLEGLPLPDRPTGGRAARLTGAVAPAAPRHGPSTEAVVVVAAGDTLWGLAAHSLPREAVEGAVAARWRAIYRLNRDVIGPDPDLIRPGQALRLPHQ